MALKRRIAPTGQGISSFVRIWVTSLPAQSFHLFQYAALLSRSLCLVSLFGMLLKSHLIVKSARSFDASQKLSRSGFNPWGGLCHKNRQFRNTLPLLLFTYFKSTFYCGFSGFIITYIISLRIVRKVFRKMDINLVSS